MVIFRSMAEALRNGYEYYERIDARTIKVRIKFRDRWGFALVVMNPTGI